VKQTVLKKPLYVIQREEIKKTEGKMTTKGWNKRCQKSPLPPC